MKFRFMNPILILAIVTTLAFLTSFAFAQDTAGLFKSKCVACHGATGAGKAAMKGSNLLTDEVKKKSDTELSDAIAKGGTAKKAAHIYEKKGITAEQTKSLVDYIRDLQKK